MSYASPDEISVIFEKFTDEEYRFLANRLTLFAVNLVSRSHLVWQGISRGNLPKGYEPQDIVSEAIIDALEGKRNWNRTEYISLEKFLKSVIKSKVSHLATSSDNKLMRSAEVKVSGDSGDVVDLIENAPSTSPNPREAIAARDFIDKFMSFLEGDDDLQYLVTAMGEKGNAKPRELAAALDLSPKKINNMKKRLDGRLRKFRKIETNDRKGKEHDVGRI